MMTMMATSRTTRLARQPPLTALGSGRRAYRYSNRGSPRIEGLHESRDSKESRKLREFGVLEENLDAEYERVMGAILADAGKAH
jgi:hypothetical protein